jgi:hypothetical protein
MVYLLFLFSPKQTILQARACIKRELATLSARTARQKALAALHADALNLLTEVKEMPRHGLVVTENVCFDTQVPITAFEYHYDDSGSNATIKERIAYYYNTTSTSSSSTTTTTTTSTTKIVSIL